MLNVLWADKLRTDLKARDIATFMMVVKLSRAHWSPEHQDHAVDIAGYAACFYECVMIDLDLDAG